MRRRIWLPTLALAGVLLTDSGAQAVGSTSITDGDGVDYDAACNGPIVGNPPGANSYGSPGGVGCGTTSVYDGSTEATDLKSASLASNANGQLVATCEIDGAIPAAGSAGLLDRPHNEFTGIGCKVMFQNKTIQTLAKYTACPQRPPRPTPVVNRFGTWKDGYHFFVGLKVAWDGTRWVHIIQEGEYDPSPDGGFIYNVLGRNTGSGWTNVNRNHAFGVDWSITIAGTGPTTITIMAPGVLKVRDTVHCSSGIFEKWYAKSGDFLGNVKAITSANRGVTVGSRSGAAMYLSDITSGNSNAGLANSNVIGIAYSTGAGNQAIAWEWTDLLTTREHAQETGRRYGVKLTHPDTKGPGPTCPKPTHGGAVQENPLFTPDTACHIDDDALSRGSVRPEFWDTVHSFTF